MSKLFLNEDHSMFGSFSFIWAFLIMATETYFLIFSCSDLSLALVNAGGSISPSI